MSSSRSNLRFSWGSSPRPSSPIWRRTTSPALFCSVRVAGPIPDHLWSEDAGRWRPCCEPRPVGGAVESQASGHDLETPHPFRPIQQEIAAVEGENSLNLFTLCDSDQRRVGEIHGKIMVFLHQLTHTRQILQVQGEEGGSTALEELP